VDVPKRIFDSSSHRAIVDVGVKKAAARREDPEDFPVEGTQVGVTVGRLDIGHDVELLAELQLLLFKLAHANLRQYRNVHERLDVASLLGEIERWLQRLEASSFQSNPLGEHAAPKLGLLPEE